MKNILQLLVLALLLHNCTGGPALNMQDGESKQSAAEDSQLKQTASSQRQKALKSDQGREEYEKALGYFDGLVERSDCTLEDAEDFLDVHQEQADQQSKYGSGGRTFLHIALEQRRTDVMEAVLEASAKELVNSKNRSGRTPLHVAAMAGDLEMVKVLANAEGVNINERAKKGGHVLHYAVAGGYLEMVKFLVEECEDIMSVDDVFDRDKASLLQVALQDCSVGKTDAAKKMLEYLLGKSKDPSKLVNNQETKYGCTVLHLAVSLRKVEIIKLLLRFGADKNIKMYDDEEEGTEGDTPYIQADRDGYTEIASLLK